MHKREENWINCTVRTGTGVGDDGAGPYPCSLSCASVSAVAFGVSVLCDVGLLYAPQAASLGSLIMFAHPSCLLYFVMRLRVEARRMHQARSQRCYSSASTGTSPGDGPRVGCLQRCVRCFASNELLRPLHSRNKWYRILAAPLTLLHACPAMIMHRCV